MPDEIEQLTAAMCAGTGRPSGRSTSATSACCSACAVAACRARRGRDEHFCLDVVHDAVLRIVRTIRPVRGGEGQLIAWLRLVVRSVAYDLLRREQRRAAREQAASAGRGAGRGTPTARTSPSSSPGCAGRSRALDPQIVELIELRYERRWTLAAIGHASACPPARSTADSGGHGPDARLRAKEAFDEPG